jgi:hypothetical protein
MRTGYRFVDAESLIGLSLIVSSVSSISPDTLARFAGEGRVRVNPLPPLRERKREIQFVEHIEV